jgi:hypothetical protein
MHVPEFESQDACAQGNSAQSLTVEQAAQPEIGRYMHSFDAQEASAQETGTQSPSKKQVSQESTGV